MSRPGRYTNWFSTTWVTPFGICPLRISSCRLYGISNRIRAKTTKKRKANLVRNWWFMVVAPLKRIWIAWVSLTELMTRNNTNDFAPGLFLQRVWAGKDVGKMETAPFSKWKSHLLYMRPNKFQVTSLWVWLFLIMAHSVTKDFLTEDSLKVGEWIDKVEPLELLIGTTHIVREYLRIHLFTGKLPSSFHRFYVHGLWKYLTPGISKDEVQNKE